MKAYEKSYRTAVREPDVFDILSATWVLACNDNKPIMVYQSIKHCLDLSDSYDIDNVKTLIRSRGELFRRGVPQKRLKEWKDSLLVDETKRPSWIREITDLKEQGRVIEALGPDDVFRSQFRAERDAPRANVELIQWGLNTLSGSDGQALNQMNSLQNV